MMIIHNCVLQSCIIIDYSLKDIRQLFMEVDLDEEQLETESYGQIEDRLRKERAQAALMGQEN